MLDDRSIIPGAAGEPPPLLPKRVPEGSPQKPSAAALWRKGGVALLKGLCISALAMAPGSLLLAQGWTKLGTLWMFLAGFILMARTYRRPWKLGRLTCSMPAVTAVLCLGVQWAFLHRVFPPPLLLLAAVTGGAVFGFIRSRVHEVSRQADGAIMARRTFGYLLVWIAAYVLTQVLATLSQHVLLVKGSMLSSTFTTMMVATFSACLLFRVQAFKKVPPVLSVVIFALLTTMAPREMLAQDVRDTKSLLDRIFLESDFDVGLPVTQRELSSHQEVAGGPLCHFKAFTHATASQGRSVMSGTTTFSISVKLALLASPEDAKRQFDGWVNIGQRFQKYDITIAGPNRLGDEFAYGQGVNEMIGIRTGTGIVYSRHGPYAMFVLVSQGVPSGTQNSAANGRILLARASTAAERVWTRMAQFVPMTSGAPAPVAPAPVRPQTAPAAPPPRENHVPPAPWIPPMPVDIDESPGTLPADDAATVATIVAILMAAGGISIQIAQALAQAIADAMRAAAQRAAEESTRAPPTLTDADGEPVLIHDGTQEGGKPGQCWMDGRWVDREEAEEMIRERQRQLAERQREIDANLARDEQRSRERQIRNEREAAIHAEERERDRLREKAEEERQRQQQERIASRMKAAAGASGDEEWRREVEELIRAGDHDALRDLYRERLGREIDSSIQESAEASAEARRKAMAEEAAAFTRDAARAGLMAVGGPAGFVPTAIGVGAISGAGEGAAAHAEGGSAVEILQRTAGGFVSGVKDAGTAAITNMSGVGVIGKVLAPAAADAAETYVRTGDGRAALGTALVSMVSSVAGAKVDGIEGGAAKEAASALTSMLTGGATSVAQGGTFGDGMKSGLTSHVAGRAGAAGAGSLAGRATPDVDPLLDEKRILEARKVGKNASENGVEQGPITKELAGTKRVEPVLTPDGKVRVNPRTGEPVTETYVDTRTALKQLAHPAESRTAKHGDQELVETIIRTRNERIYGPADRATIATVTPVLEANGILKPGDRLVMDTFPTPGKAPGLGADRDARLVIERRGPFGKTERVEVPLQHWGRQAEADFARHTMPIAGEVTPQTHPDYYRRIEELQHMKNSGWSDEMIRNRAWAESHNQLFTDRHHIEASADNSDQSGFLRDSSGRAVALGPSQVKSPVLDVAAGKRQLADPEGFGRMWGEKTKFYEHDMPEAVAQSQKGIDSYLKLREGYRANGMEPSPMNHNVARAMEALGAAPTGMAATPEKMAALDAELRDLGYESPQHAMSAVAGHFEALKWSKPQGAGTGLSSRALADMAADRAREDEERGGS